MAFQSTPRSTLTLVGMKNFNAKRLLAALPAPVAALCLLLTSFTATTNRALPENPAELGEALFFDPKLSVNNTVSCASCHKPEFGFADNVPLSFGVNGNLTSRNTPSAMYPEITQIMFWDGRAQTLEHQAFFPITHPKEMGMLKEEVIKKLNADAYYAKAFEKIFHGPPKVETVSRALADFQRTLAYYESPYDRFYDGDDKAISASALNGLALFVGKANCSECHRLGKAWHDREFGTRNIGLYNGKEYNDPGRFAITGDSADLGAFKVTHLRNIALTAPYMHDGSLKTLREVIEFYNKPSDFVKGALNVDENMKDSLNLTDQEMKDLEALMLTFTDDGLQERIEHFKAKERRD